MLNMHLQKTIMEVKAKREYPESHSKKSWKKFLSLRSHTIVLGISKIARSQLKIRSSGDISICRRFKPGPRHHRQTRGNASTCKYSEK